MVNEKQKKEVLDQEKDSDLAKPAIKEQRILFCGSDYYGFSFS